MEKAIYRHIKRQIVCVVCGTLAFSAGYSICTASYTPYPPSFRMSVMEQAASLPRAFYAILPSLMCVSRVAVASPLTTYTLGDIITERILRLACD